MEKVIDLTKKLIRIQSVVIKEKELNEALEICGKVLRDYSFKEFKKNGSRSRLYYNTKNLPNKFRLILNAHLDVVPGKPKQFSPFIKEDKLFGRGAQDMKAAAAVFILLFSRNAKDLSFPIGLQLVTDEEIGGFMGTNFQIDKEIRADFIISGEPTDMLINNEAKGVLWVEFVIKGKSSHAAYVWNGDNAIVRTTSLVNLLLKNFPLPKDEKWQTTCNISKIETKNDAINKVPEECRLIVDIRYVPEDLERVKDTLAKCVNSSISVKYLEKGTAAFTEESNKDIKLLRQIVGFHKQSAKFIKKHGASDVRFYNALGMKGITFGPIGAGLHSDNEWVSLTSLATYYKVMREFLDRIR